MNPGTAAVPNRSDPQSPASWLWLGLQVEFALFRRPMFVLSVLAIVLVPSLYAVFYISSFWDPYGHLDRLPAALVNTDRGVVRDGRNINVGNTTVNLLTQHPTFHFIRLPSAEAAHEALRSGKVYFALIIPDDFSERAITARQARPAEFTLQVAEGDGYTSAIISKRFGSELAHTLNEQLNRERWTAIVGDPVAPAGDSVRAAIAELRDGSQSVREGAQRVQEGAGQLDTGLDKAADGTRRLNDALGQIAAGVRLMRGQLPSENQLQELADGSKAAVAGQEKLAAGMNQLVAGGNRLDQGAKQLRQGAAKVPFAGHRLSAGAAQLENGMATLETNLVLVAAGGHQLNTGLEQLNDGIQPLTGGILQLETGLDTMIAQLPSADQDGPGPTASGQLRNSGEELTNGMARLREGSHHLLEGSKELAAGSASLALGLSRLNTSFSDGFGDADGGGLAAPVLMNLETSTPLPNNGTGFSPYFAALTLWLGGIMITFVFHCRRLIEPMREAPRWVCWLTKAAVPLGIGTLQGTTIVAVLHLGFGIAFAHPCQVWLAAILGSLAFVSVILLLIAVLGDAGRLPAVVLLILQLASAGGIYPVELSGRFYEAIHPYLPFTALVTAFRATMFGAYDAAWLMPAVQLAVTGGSAVILAIWFARWKFIPRNEYGPAVELS
ncbi:MAG: YhgE/Pip domain-containing protein [Verrucomicrobiota bacterium]|jgi:putative membrane protein